MEFNTKNIKVMGELFAAELKRCGLSSSNKLYEVENAMRELQRQVSLSGLADFLEEADMELHKKSKKKIKKAGFYFHSYHPAVLWSVFGKVKFERRYYRKKVSERGDLKGIALLDKKMGYTAGQVSPGLAELLALEGISTPFGEASRKLEKYLLFPVSENTVRKETEKYGAIQAEIEKEEIARSQDAKWLQRRERSEKRRLAGRIYGSVDGFMVPLQEGWKEFRVLAWYKVAQASPYTKRYRDKVGELPPLQAKEISYRCDKLDPKEFGKLLWASGVQKDVDLYEEQVFIGDAAKWIWKMVDLYYPNATQILDWYHASQYIYRLAEAVFDIGSEEYENWVQKSKLLLWNGKVEQLIRTCKSLADRPNSTEAIHTTVTFYENNKKRMDYARYRDEGYFIGSGTIESAAKRLRELRLKEAGARWSKMGAIFTAKARAAWLGGQWQPILDRASPATNLPFAI